MKLPEPCRKMLMEWNLDCIEVERKYRQTLPHAALVRDAYLNPKQETCRELMEWLKADLENEIGIVPPKDTVLVDAYCDNLGLPSLRKEQHEMYWWLRSALDMA